MKSKKFETGLAMLMMAAGVGLVAACTTEMRGEDQAQSAQSDVTANATTPDQPKATEVTLPDSPAELAPGAAAPANRSAADGVINPRVPCRRVTASSIPVFSSPTGGGVLCTFFQGDVFSEFGQIVSNGRWVTWCPRGVPPSQGTTAYAQNAGTVNGGC